MLHGNASILAADARYEMFLNPLVLLWSVTTGNSFPFRREPTCQAVFIHTQFVVLDHIILLSMNLMLYLAHDDELYDV